jgi:GT2 family glycosyltransferase
MGYPQPNVVSTDCQRVSTDISVIVPAFNAAEVLGSCLEALARQTLPRTAYEIIVVDDGSTDRTAEVARAQADRVLTVPNGGPGLARNAGARVARGGILVFTDADCRPEPDFLEKLTAPWRENPAIVGGKGVYRSEQRALTARFVQAEYEDRYRRMAEFECIDFVDTYAAAFRRETFLAYGGYSPLFPLASVEDQEFSFRLAEAGEKIVYCPEARTLHRHAATPGQYLRKKWKIAFWKMLVLKLHPGKGLRDTHTPQRLKLHLVLTPLALLGTVAWMAGLVGGWALLLPALSVALEGPFMRRLWSRDRAVALLTPLFVWGRSLALAGGMVAGWLNFAFFASRRPESREAPAARR